MATIEQRAKEYMHGDIESPVRLAMYDAYIDGAKDQKAIDDEEWRKDMRYMNIQKQKLIDKACKWLEERCAFGVHPCGGTALVMDFRKAMEE